MSGRLVVALGALLWPTLAWAQTPPTEVSADSDPGATKAQAAPQGALATLQVQVEPEGEIHVGDPVTVRVTAVAPAGTRVRLPEPNVEPFELVERTDKPAEKLEDGQERHVFELELLRFEPGEATLPPLDLRVVAPDDTVQTLQTDPRDVEILSWVDNEPNAEPRGPTEPVVVLEEDYTLAWVGGGLLAALAVAALGYWYARYRAKHAAQVATPPPPPRPAWEVALEKLSDLETQRDSLLSEGRAAEYVDGVSDVVREYLGALYGFDGLESTTDEVVDALSAKRRPELPMTDVVMLLSDCDLVKFAKADPDAELCDNVHAQALRMVERTKPKPQPAEMAAPAQAPEAPT